MRDKQGRRVGTGTACGPRIFVKEVRVISVQGPQQKESRRNCCNSPPARRVPKTQIPSADSLTERLPERKILFSEFRKEHGGTLCRFSVNDSIK